MNDKQNGVIVRTGFVAPNTTGACDIALGDAGFWNDAGVAKFRKADGTDKTLDATSLAAGSILISKLKSFKSTEQTGTGSSQNIAHGLGVVPGLVFFMITSDTATQATGATYVEGAHDSTNLKMTVTSGAKFKIVAFA